jgi:adsorption protein B
LSVAIWTGAWKGPAPEVFNPEGLFGAVVTLNVGAFFLRLLQRAWFVSRIYGWENGILSGPRLIAGTIVNAAATLRALRQFALSKITGRKLTWDKTMHHFPTGNELVLPPRSLGEVLLSWRAISEDELEKARAAELRGEGPLGELLLESGAVDATTLAEAAAYTSDLTKTQEPTALAARQAPAGEPLKVL